VGYALYGFAADPEAPQEMQRGHREGIAHFRGKTKPTDMVVRKWLPLRSNAIKRKARDAQTQAEFRHDIHDPTGGYLPA
jgi:hypothetical protein